MVCSALASIPALPPDRRSRGCVRHGDTLLSRPGRGAALAPRPMRRRRRLASSRAAELYQGRTEIRFPGRSCRKRFESRLTPWVAMSAHRSSFPAPRSRIEPASRHRIPAVRRQGADRARTGQASGAEGGLARRSTPTLQSSMDDKPSQALRRGRKTSSMWLAIDAVKKGEADVAVSAGNTGALMAMARFNLRMLPGIDRPAIAAVWPTAARRSGGARSRRYHRRRRAPSGRAGGDGQRDGERAVQPRTADASACSISASRRSRATRRSARPPNCCAR